jgi:hypothetical protein
MRSGDASEERLADRTGAAVGGVTAPAETTARAAGLRGERVMTDPQRPAPLGGEPALVRSCWLCGIRLPAHQMVADGGSACPDLRWYCRDTWGCTRRWTSHSARLSAVRPGIAETQGTSGERAAGRAAARPVAV